MTITTIDFTNADVEFSAGNLCTTIPGPIGVTSAVGTLTYDAPTPPPPPQPTKFGNTPRGTSNAAGVAAVDAIYGPGAAIRLFHNTTLPAPDVTDRFTVGSFKTMTGYATHLPEWDRVFYMHEADKKISDGLISLSQWQSDMADIVSWAASNGCPDVPGICLTGWCFDAASGLNPADYLIDGVTHLGVDFDGISGNSTTYHNYDTVLSNVVDFADDHGLTWGVPEFGTNKAAVDTTDSYRAAWLRKYANHFKIYGAEYVCAWEQTGTTGSTFAADATLNTVATILAVG
jgi:hypothetical protein